MPIVLPPLVSLAVSVLPNLAKRVADNVLPGVEQKVTNAVKEVLGTDDIQVAENMLQDPKVAAELRVRLAEIEVEADKVEAEREAKRRAAELEAMKVELERFRSELADTQGARASMGDLVKAGSPLQWAPAAVSLVVVVGFFFTVFYLIYLLRHPAEAGTADNSAVIQIVNIAVGALTAGFATVVSFWLGSSQGSREKDRLSVQTQAAASVSAAEQTRQATELLGRIATTPPVQVAAAVVQGGPRPKDARQFGRCVDLVLGFEGGFVDHPSDPGGATNMGITLATLTAWRRKTAEPGVAMTISAQDVRELGRDEATEIYRAEYWNALNCDNLPTGVDLVVFDFGVNAGPGRSARLLQEVVHVDKDGQIGKITTGAAQSIDPAHIINAFSNGRMDHYRGLSTWETFKNGWTRRTQEISAAALEMAKG